MRNIHLFEFVSFAWSRASIADTMAALVGAKRQHTDEKDEQKSGISLLGSGGSKKRWAQLMFGKASVNYGFYTTILPPEKPVAEKPVRFLDKSLKAQAVKQAIFNIKSYKSGLMTEHFDWSEYEHNRTGDSIIRSAKLIAGLPHVWKCKVGITTDPLWRHVLCDGQWPNNSMMSHWPEFDDMFVLTCDYGPVCGGCELIIVAELRECNFNNFVNIKDGFDGTIRDVSTFVYMAVKRLPWHVKGE